MLAARVATALVLLAGLLSALFWLPSAGWLMVVAMVVAVAAFEWGGLSRYPAGGRWAYAGASCGAFVACAVALLGEPPGRPALDAVFGIAAAFWIMVVPFWLARHWKLTHAAGAAAVGWLVLIPPALAMVLIREAAPILLLAAMALVWVADIAAYFTGRAFGRHKLAPSVSPGKTWEGAAGAGVGTVLYGLLVAWAGGLAMTGELVIVVAVAALALTAISILGDLFESLLKRQANVKDSGTLLPGHGGVLDRIDSLTSTLPWIGLAVLLWRTGGHG